MEKESADKDKIMKFGAFRKAKPPADLYFDYKESDNLKRFVTEHGRIVPRRISRLNSKQQRELTIAIKRARILALLPFTE